jgi:cytochrome c-type biogenesis protein CcmH
MMIGSNRLVAWTVVAVAAIALLVVASVDDGTLETDTERIQRLSDSFACPECKGESVAESGAAVSALIRQHIADQVEAGATDIEIRDSLVDAYGARVLLNPPADGLASLLWILPVALVVGGAAAVSTMVKRSGVGSGPTVTDADRELVERARAESGGDR